MGSAGRSSSSLTHQVVRPSRTPGLQTPPSSRPAASSSSDPLCWTQEAHAERLLGEALELEMEPGVWRLGMQSLVLGRRC
jgi:hypothetical protein